MGWIVVGILLFIGPYTYLTIHYRKRAPAYLPYEDTVQRVRAARAGYQRIVASSERLADPPPAGEGAGTAAGGLPAALRDALRNPVLLPASFRSVDAARSVDQGAAYVVSFACTMADSRQQPSEAELYVREDAIYIVPACERLAGDLVARTREAYIAVTVPRRSLSPGRYHVTLVGADSSLAWPLQVH